MKYGKYTALVEEVIDFSRSDRVLSAIGRAEETNLAWIINDLNLALEMSAGDEPGLFRVSPELDVRNWGNTELLNYNLTNQGHPDLTIDDLREDLTWTWHDLTENLVADLIKTREYWQRTDRHQLHDPLFREFQSKRFQRELRDRLATIFSKSELHPDWQHPAERLANNIACELMWCAENRAFNGPTDNFWERLFGLYQQGYWPCGWRGVFPRPGKFVAYRRACQNGDA
jgi:hypothetical protein